MRLQRNSWHNQRLTQPTEWYDSHVKSRSGPLPMRNKERTYPLSSTHIRARLILAIGVDPDTYKALDSENFRYCREYLRLHNLQQKDPVPMRKENRRGVTSFPQLPTIAINHQPFNLRNHLEFVDILRTMKVSMDTAVTKMTKMEEENSTKCIL
ncbi:unnamed protein product [Caenorhabditis nigoni]